jgi:hypothetical protein
MQKKSELRGPYLKTDEDGLPKRRKSKAVTRLREKAAQRKERLELAKKAIARKDSKLKLVIAENKMLKDELKAVSHLIKSQESEKQAAILRGKILHQDSIVAQKALRNDLDVWAKKTAAKKESLAKKKSR